MPSDRIYHHYSDWEDYKAGMWRELHGYEYENMLSKAIAFTGDHVKYGKAMIKVTESWPIACEHNLTNESQNRKAWIGHAAACLAINCPESITRKAWGCLTPTQQELANKAASKAIRIWEKKYYRSKQSELF